MKMAVAKCGYGGWKKPSCIPVTENAMRANSEDQAKPPARIHTNENGWRRFFIVAVIHTRFVCVCGCKQERFGVERIVEANSDSEHVKRYKLHKIHLNYIYIPNTTLSNIRTTADGAVWRPFAIAFAMRSFVWCEQYLRKAFCYDMHVGWEALFCTCCTARRTPTAAQAHIVTMAGAQCRHAGRRPSKQSTDAGKKAQPRTLVSHALPSTYTVLGCVVDTLNTIHSGISHAMPGCRVHRAATLRHSGSEQLFTRTLPKLRAGIPYRRRSAICWNSHWSCSVCMCFWSCWADFANWNAEKEKRPLATMCHCSLIVFVQICLRGLWMTRQLPVAGDIHIVCWL